MTHTPEVSVIMPIYNAEKWVSGSIESVLAQTFSDIELVLVDDGSTDNSGAICDEYARKDERVKVIHRHNGGEGAARQSGLDVVNGRWVIHCDADDRPESVMIEEMLAHARKTNADMVWCDISFYDDNGSHVSRQGTETETAAALLSALTEGRVMGTVWNKLIRRKVAQSVGFDIAVRCCVDLIYCVELLIANPDIKVAHLPRALYRYWQNPQSALHTMTAEKTVATYTTVVDRFDKLMPEEKSTPRFYFYKRLVISGIYKRGGVQRTVSDVQRDTSTHLQRDVSVGSLHPFRLLPHGLSLHRHGSGVRERLAPSPCRKAIPTANFL